MYNKETIFSFFDTKYPNHFDVTVHTEMQGLSAMVFDINYDGEMVCRVIKYHELPKAYTVCSKELLYQVKVWFDLSPFKCESLFSEWLKMRSTQKIVIEKEDVKIVVPII